MSNQQSSTSLCKYCNSNDVVKAGTRKLTNKQAANQLQKTKQLFKCNSCKRIFSNNNKTNKRTDQHIILNSLILACQSHSLEETSNLIKKKFKTNIAKSTISKWIKHYNPRYLNIKHINTKHRKIIETHLFQHKGINYNYRYHIPKLAAFCKYEQLTNYLINVPKLNQSIFETSQKSSKLNLNPNIKLFSKPAHPVISKILTLAKSNGERHEILESYLLSCDRDTIAAEVPVYFYDKQLGNISGHIDLLQLKDGKIHIVDYKPNAKTENKESVTTQLNLYALALSFRTKIPLNNFICTYFDQNNEYQFRPTYVINKPKPL